MAEEIEASAESIVLSAMCLEAFINGFARDHLHNEWTDEDEKSSAEVKWFCIPTRLNHPNCFEKSKQPYQNFKKLIDWRNDYIVHYKHKFEFPISSKNGLVSKIYAICNADNAAMAISTVQKMIVKLNECCEFDIPNWVRNSGVWLSPLKRNLKTNGFEYSEDSQDNDLNGD